MDNKNNVTPNEGIPFLHFCFTYSKTSIQQNKLLMIPRNEEIKTIFEWIYHRRRRNDEIATKCTIYIFQRRDDFSVSARDQSPLDYKYPQLAILSRTIRFMMHKSPSQLGN